MMDGLCTCRLDAAALRGFLMDCFEVPASEIFVGHRDQVDELLRDVQRAGPFAVFCTYADVGGDFCSSFSIGAGERVAELAGIDGEGLAGALAGFSGGGVLCGFGTEPEPWLWTLVGPEGNRELVHLDEDNEGFTCSCQYLHRVVI
ncbi:hypothetical protein F3087_34620 [Nocardia colli]|uniref:Uncharacterized protein n=1 Tax=Nocardia colli TaxID=2545717 RepID=A0A5N0E4I6_9NOCA|nr:hypothetical protein [Nocardia colli]KAA8884348.1 hypothetical protein F3087_34620 [Nocardia colli]